MADPFNMELKPMEDEPEIEWDMGPGHLEVYVSLNTGTGHKRVFEFEVLDYSGCADWMQEGVGFDYWITDMSGVVGELKVGCTYVFHGITVSFTRGDGWTTDDDEEWEFEALETRWNPWTRGKQLLINAWWLTLGHRIRNWLAKR